VQRNAVITGCRLLYFWALSESTPVLMGFIRSSSRVTFKLEARAQCYAWDGVLPEKETH
jgi:hypothetical protein